MIRSLLPDTLTLELEYRLGELMSAFATVAMGAAIVASLSWTT